MKFLSSSFLVVLSFCFLNCSDMGTTPVERFPEGLYQAGRDSDHSFVSLQTTRLQNGDLLIRVTGWGYYETGLSLSSERQDRVLILQVMGECGTGQQFTWAKVSFDYTLTRTDEDSIDVIRAVGLGTEIVLRKQP